MSASFDPYHKWLGVTRKEQPPNHYRLLGIALFESDRDVVCFAADQRMALVRTFQTGEHAVLSRQILDEISKARVCLLDSQKKARYDALLCGPENLELGDAPRAEAGSEGWHTRIQYYATLLKSRESQRVDSEPGPHDHGRPSIENRSREARRSLPLQDSEAPAGEAGAMSRPPIPGAVKMDKGAFGAKSSPPPRAALWALLGLLGLLIFVILWGVVNWPSREPTVAENASDAPIAWKTFKVGYLEQAIADYTQAIPQTTNYGFDCGRRNTDPRKYDKAIADFTEVIRLDPENGEAYSWRAHAYNGKGEYDGAIADYTQVIRLDSKDANAYTALGIAYANNGDYGRAIAEYTEASRLDSMDAEPYLFRAAAYAYKGDFEKAIADCTEGIRLEPESAEAYRCRGSAYYANADYDRAIADFTEGIRLDSKDAMAYCCRARAYADKSNFDDAIADHTEAIRLDPQNAMMYRMRGLTYQRYDYAQEAEADLAKAKQLAGQP